ncbi:hypothetical protein [Nostoc sp.]|uniref:hypothetical protein n=1 Tax=Nostoc sp. TaxID=1180 RepID=UPI002FFCB8D2
MSNKLAIAISDGCANAKGERLSSSCGFSRILYQKALEIAQLSLEVNHPNAMPDCAIALGVGAAIAVATGSTTMILASTTYLQLTITPNKVATKILFDKSFYAPSSAFC